MEAGTLARETVDVPVATVATMSFNLVGLPGSMNELFEYPARDSGRPVRRLKNEWAIWKTRAKPMVPMCYWPKTSLFKVEMGFESATWICKNGNIRRRDVDNLEKLILDTIFEKLGRDDSRVVHKVSTKIIGPEEQVHIVLTEVDEETWKSS